MFSVNRGTHVLKTSPASTADTAPLFWVASYNNETDAVFIKVHMSLVIAFAPIDCVLGIEHRVKGPRRQFLFRLPGNWLRNCHINQLSRP
jgi:hypothetical protein